jgi:hypothetical protein
MRDDEHILNGIRNGSGNEVRIFACPKCAGQLKVGFHRGQRMMSAKVECKRCDYIVRMDGLAVEPRWVSELGTEFETAP